MPSYILRISNNSNSKQINFNRIIALRAEANSQYTLLDGGTQQPVMNSTIARKGSTLEISVEGKKLLYINRFYTEGANASFEAAGVSTQSSSEASFIENLSNKISSPNLSLEQLPSISEIKLPSVNLETTKDKLMWGGLAGLGVIGLVALTQDDKDDSPAPTISNTVSGTISAGPLVSGNDLKVSIKKTDGTEITTATISNGRFSADIGSHQGLVVIEVSNGGNKADYLDETTNTNLDIGQAVLYAIGNHTGGPLQLNVNPLTTLAYHKIQQQGFSIGNSNNINKAVAEVFGIDDLHKTTPITTNDSSGSFDGSNGLSAAEQYGAWLAAISGAGGLDSTIYSLRNNTTINGNLALLNDTARQLLNQGSSNYLAAAGAKDMLLITSANLVKITEYTHYQSPFYTATAASKSNVSFTLGGTDASAFTFNNNQLKFVQAPDFDVKSGYNITLTATSGNMSSQQAVHIAIEQDKTAPSMSLKNPGTIYKDNNIVVQSGEIGTVYVVHNSITPTKITDITGISDSSKWKAIPVSAALTDASIAATGLGEGNYKFYAADQAGNIAASAQTLNISNTIDTKVVIFDLTQGVSSAHSSRSFAEGVAYKIYIKVGSTSNTLSIDGTGNGPSDSWGKWSGANKLGSDDQIILIGSGANIKGKAGGEVNGFSAQAAVANWKTANNLAAAMTQNGKLSRISNNATVTQILWDGQWANLNQGQALAQVYANTIPAGLLLSQGLA